MHGPHGGVTTDQFRGTHQTGFNNKITRGHDCIRSSDRWPSLLGEATGVGAAVALALADAGASIFLI